MAYCTSCGAQNADDSKFCIYCGAQLTVPQPAQEAPSAEPAQPYSKPEPQLSEQPLEHIYQQPEQPAYQQPAAQQTGYQQPGYQQPGYQQAADQQPGYQQAQASSQYVTPVATGGLLAWSIISILLCLIPGIVALVQTLGINKSVTVEEQKKKLNSAKTWCIVSTALGVLSIIYNLARR